MRGVPPLPPVPSKAPEAFNANFVAIGDTVAVVVVKDEQYCVVAFGMRKHNATRVNGDVERRVV